jgi:drug/metabolite transporter (DMT)-like permease
MEASRTYVARVRSGSVRREELLPLAAALLTVALWASAFVGIRSAGRDISPGALSLCRLVVGAIALGAVVAIRREPLPTRRDLPPIVLCGVLWFGIYNVALNEAERRVDAGTAAMLVNIGPIFIAILAGVILREGFPRALVAGCAIAFAGVMVIGLATSEHGVQAGWGALLCVVAALAYAGAVVAQKPVLARVSSLQVTFLGCAIGAIACLPFAPTLVSDAANARSSAIAWAIYLGVIPTAIGFTTWAYALARTTAGRMGSTTYLVPPLAILMGWAILGESPPALAFAGGALCLAGVAVARGASRRSLAPPGKDAGRVQWSAIAPTEDAARR